MITKKGSDAPRRLLVISYHFPPDGSIGGQRWAGLSKYLARVGWEVHVVTASAPTGHVMPDGVYRHYRPRRLTLNELYRARNAARNVQSEASEAAPGGPGTRRRNPLTNALVLARRIVGSAIGLPDQGRGWIARATGAALGLMRAAEFDCVISSGPPHSAHIAAMIATFGRKADFWIDMRDPWAMTYEMNSAPNRFIRAERHVLHVLERMILPRAARVLVNTSEFASALRATQPDLDVTHFPNGIDLEALPLRDMGAVKIGSISYVGTLYAGRNLSPILAAMSQLTDEPCAPGCALTLNVAGPLESPHREQMHSEIERLGLTDSVHVLGVLPRARALELLSSSHLALVLAQDQPMCVPAKLYESVGLGVPTLVIAEKNSAAAREARRIGALTAEAEDVDGIRTILTDLVAGRIPAQIAPSAPISYESLAVEMDRILREATLRVHSATSLAKDSLPHPV